MSIDIFLCDVFITLNESCIIQFLIFIIFLCIFRVFTVAFRRKETIFYFLYERYM